jgi:2-keto-4-pentenoate hydratase/2-oxohepta-3-ene-1,7-dioic acid hydratase in catechol pathway
MKLLRVGELGQEKIAALDSKNIIRDLSNRVSDLTSETFNNEYLDKVKNIDLAKQKEINPQTRIGPFVNNPKNYFCVGKNFHLHALEVGSKAPKDPMIFSKANCISGPNDNIIIPKDSKKVDWECEIGVCLKEDVYQIKENESEKYIGGYFLANDVSARDFQLEKSGQFIIGKSSPTFGPIGPYLVTPDEIDNAQHLKMKTIVNGKIMQDGNTKDMIHSINYVIAYLSTFIKLNRGDLIIFGTPDGVGAGMKPNPVFLKDGDIIELEIEGLGKQKHKVINQS